jgi:DNA-binding transcriptional MerR regulator
MKYFYTIGEVSNLLGVKPHVIRYWESEFSFLKPRKSEGRIRKYSEENVQLLRRIQDMLHNQRFTIEGARQKLKAERSAARYHQKLEETVAPAATPDVSLRPQLAALRANLTEILALCDKIKRKYQQ